MSQLTILLDLEHLNLVVFLLRIVTRRIELLSIGVDFEAVRVSIRRFFIFVDFTSYLIEFIDQLGLERCLILLSLMSCLNTLLPHAIVEVSLPFVF